MHALSHQESLIKAEAATKNPKPMIVRRCRIMQGGFARCEKTRVDMRHVRMIRLLPKPVN